MIIAKPFGFLRGYFHHDGFVARHMELVIPLIKE